MYSRIYSGKDIFSDEKGMAIYQTGKYINDDDKVVYLPSSLGQYANPEYYEVSNIINYCRFNLKNDYYGYLINKKGDRKKRCFLTFEVGLSENTEAINDMLREYGANATFFHNVFKTAYDNL